MGLQTVTWLLDGELMHRDSLGSEQAIRPGQLNLMTAGLGVAHAEEGVTGYRGPIHGIQLWVAQPSATRDAPPAFEHHAELPKVEFSGGVGTVPVGEVAGASSPARRDTEHVGLDLNLHPGDTSIPLDRSYEYAVVVTIGTVTIPGQTVGPGHLVYLGSGRDQLDLHIDDAGRALLLGGVPCAEPLLMWWNFVARTRDEVEVAYEDWASDSGRFGMVDSSLPRIETTRPVWRPPTR